MKSRIRILGQVALLAAAATAVAAWARAEEPVAEDAEQIMIRAHRARAQWKDFPGFTAEVTLLCNGNRAVRSVEVDPQLRVRWDRPVPPELIPLKRRFESVVQHRAPADHHRFDVEFVPEHRGHPLGRLIRFRDDPARSRYRIRGDLIAQVSRDAGPLHFTISVLDVSRNSRGRYLPRVYTVFFWNRRTGQLVRSSTVRLEWKRVGRWDLPETIDSITTQSDRSCRAESIRVRNHRLGSAVLPERAGGP